ncbi:MAG: hypothetical protein KKF39_07075, partial [Nanoarchaeota archaeon]|nr:hypothetical protein [Nanoarchaeota archaeon]
FSNSFIDTNIFLKSLIYFSIIFIFYVSSKKYLAYYLESKEETKIWTFQRYGFYKRSHLKYPVPIGIILPFLLSIFSLGYIPWFAVTESEIKPRETRAARRHDFYSFLEMTEWDMARISSAGIFSMFILAIISYILNFPDLARLSIYFAFFNLLPLGKLDGTKIFFGSKILYSILGIITAIGLLYIWFL